MAALLLAQGLGLLHRIVHLHGPSAPQAHAHADAAVRYGMFERLFAHHHDTADCQGFDQLSHADGLPTATVESPALLAVLPSGIAAALPVIAAQAAGYLARGPPALG